MAVVNLRGVDIVYEVIGDKGPWVVLYPGGRNGMSEIKSLAGRVAAAGYRLIVHDRRNCGASDVIIEGPESELQLWADDLNELLKHLKTGPVTVGGASSGCRTSLLFGIRHPAMTRAMMLWRISGGRVGATRLANQYYGQFIKVAKEGGMKAVCDTEFFRERIAANPSNRARLMAMTTEHFLKVMTDWNEDFMAGADMPVIGASEADLRGIKVPTLLMPGNDLTHRKELGARVQKMIPGSELHEFPGEQRNVDSVPRDEWAPEPDLAAVLVRFLNRVHQKVQD